MSKRASPTLVGGFVIAGLTLALSMIILFGSGRWFRDTARVIVFFEGSVNGLRIGAPVKFRGIEIGSVSDIRINMSGALRDPRNVRIPVVLELDKKRLTAEGVERHDLDDATEIRALVHSGLRAELATESFVTNVRYVALDLKPDSPAVTQTELALPFPEIPAVRGLIEQLPDKIDSMLARLSEVDVGGIARSVQATADNARDLLASPHLRRTLESMDTLVRNANRTVAALNDVASSLQPVAAELTETAKSTRQIVSPDGALANRVSGALRELEAAARSMRRLADHLNRDPGSLLRGGRQ